MELKHKEPQYLTWKKLKKGLRLIGAALVLGLCVACATSSEKKLASSSETTTMMLPDFDSQSHADGEAYTADSMHFRKPMPSRPNWRPMEFYYKHCSSNDGKAYYSKTSYDCTSL